MKIQIVAIGTRMPAWIEAGFREYAKRLPPEYQLSLQEIPAHKRTKNADIHKIMQQESLELYNASAKADYRIILDRNGQALNTKQLADYLEKWRRESLKIALLIGGPEGVSQEILNKADEIWSLSQLTLPHPLVRIIVAEQLFRAFSILSHHPYHR